MQHRIHLLVPAILIALAAPAAAEAALPPDELDGPVGTGQGVAGGDAPGLCASLQSTTTATASLKPQKQVVITPLAPVKVKPEEVEPEKTKPADEISPPVKKLVDTAPPVKVQVEEIKPPKQIPVQPPTLSKHELLAQAIALVCGDATDEPPAREDSPPGGPLDGLSGKQPRDVDPPQDDETLDDELRDRQEEYERARELIEAMIRNRNRVAGGG